MGNGVEINGKAPIRLTWPTLIALITMIVTICAWGFRLEGKVAIEEAKLNERLDSIEKSMDVERSDRRLNQMDSVEILQRISNLEGRINNEQRNR